MRSSTGFCWSLILAVSVGWFGISSQAQETKRMQASSTPMVHMPGTPECFVMAAQQGEPSKETSILKMKGGAGCSVPWHWHPSTENIMMVSGTAHTSIKGEQPVQLAAGSFLSVPPNHVMNFVCVVNARFLCTQMGRSLFTMWTTQAKRSRRAKL